MENKATNYSITINNSTVNKMPALLTIYENNGTSGWFILDHTIARPLIHAGCLRNCNMDEFRFCWTMINQIITTNQGVNHQTLREIVKQLLYENGICHLSRSLQISIEWTIEHH